jgi:hypothetical protein
MADSSKSTAAAGAVLLALCAGQFLMMLDRISTTRN